MSDVHVLAIDLAKRSFQVCGTDRGGAVLYNRTLPRAKLKQLLDGQPPCIVAMEACATSHYWGRFARRRGHDVRLVPPIYVKPFVKRQEEAAEERRSGRGGDGRGGVASDHALRRRQERRASGARSDLPNAPMLCPPAHAVDQRLAGPSGRVRAGCPSRASHLKPFVGLLGGDTAEVPDSVREIAQLYLDQIDLLTEKIEMLTRKLKDATQENAEMRRLCTVPGVGPVTAGAVMAFAPDLRAFSSGRNFAAWLGLVPRQRSTGGKTRLGGISKMGQADIRKLLIVGAMSRIRWIVRKGVMPDKWLGRLVGRKPRMVAPRAFTHALANKMARIIWAIMTREQNYRMA